MVKKILITGASGLVAGILIEHLSKNPNYDIYGMDKHSGISMRYQLENTPVPDNQQPILPAKDKFFICDITDEKKLTNIIQDNQINIIIHLAAVLETETVEQINAINCGGTKILFGIAIKQEHVELVVYGSSGMVVAGYLEIEPYAALAKNIQPTEELKKLTIHDPVIPSHFNPSCEAYSQSKIYGEQLAKQYSSNENTNVKFICVRSGWVNTTNDVSSNLVSWGDKSTWWSYRDLCQFFDRLLENQMKLRKFDIYFACSNNDFAWRDMSNSKEDLNYVPQDGAKWNSESN